MRQQNFAGAGVLLARLKTKAPAKINFSALLSLYSPSFSLLTISLLHSQQLHVFYVIGCLYTLFADFSKGS
jgi:hypothetical protein